MDETPSSQPDPMETAIAAPLIMSQVRKVVKKDGTVEYTGKNSVEVQIQKRHVSKSFVRFKQLIKQSLDLKEEPAYYAFDTVKNKYAVSTLVRNRIQHF